MTHILYGSKAEKAYATSDAGYYPVAGQVGKHANTMAVRTDIVSVIGATAGAGAPACFYPAFAELHINTGACDLGDPEKVDFADRLWMLEHAPAVGAVQHEAAHARHTKWDPRDLMERHGATRRMLDVITTLEEPRIEANAVRNYPASKVFLRGVGLEIVGRDFVIPDTPYGAAAAAGLLLARADAKTVSKADVRGFRKEIVAVLGEDTLGTLELLWQRFLRLHDFDFDGMVQVAREWLEALDIDPENDEAPEDLVGEGMIGEPMPGDGDGSEGEGKGEGDGEGEPKDGDGDGSGFGKIIKAKVHIAESKADKAVVEATSDEKAERRRKEREADAARRKEGEREHDEAFREPSHGYTPGGFAHFVGERVPSDAERRAAKSLARTLEQIDYRDRSVTKVASITPPGRLRGRALVQAEGHARAGRDVEVPLWQGKRRRKVESTPLTIGFLSDISGSMSAAMEPMASAQWVTSTAGAHIDAKVAAVHFGERVHGITPCGVREKNVRLFYPGDGSEAFRSGALALDRELNLLDGRGARLLFIASDGHFVVDSEEEYAKTFMPLAKRKGVAVIFLKFTPSMLHNGYGASVINCQGKTPAEVAALCGKAAIAEVRRLDRRV
jgi:hypothetical protein